MHLVVLLGSHLPYHPLYHHKISFNSQPYIQPLPFSPQNYLPYQHPAGYFPSPQNPFLVFYLVAEEEVGGRGKPICQVCNKAGHVALQCYHRFDFQGKNSQRAASSFPANFSANSQGFPVNSQGSSLSGYSPGSFPGNSHGFSGNSQPSSIPGYFPYNPGKGIVKTMLYSNVR